MQPVLAASSLHVQQPVSTSKIMQKKYSLMHCTHTYIIETVVWNQKGSERSSLAGKKL